LFIKISLALSLSSPIFEEGLPASGVKIQ